MHMTNRQAKTDQLIIENLPLADRLGASAARRLCGLAEKDDLIQEARMALVLAARKCDEQREPTAYIIASIRGAIQHYVRDKVRMVRVSRREHEKSRPPFAHTSLDACLPCGTPFVDLLTADPVTTDQADESPEELEALVEQLPAADAAALRLTLLQGMSLRQAGEALGVSVMTAQRRKERAVKAIREALQA